MEQSKTWADHAEYIKTTKYTDDMLVDPFVFGAMKAAAILACQRLDVLIERRAVVNRQCEGLKLFIDAVNGFLEEQGESH